MGWPKDLILRALSRDGQEPLRDLVLYLTIVTPSKNSYSIGPLLTDERGEVHLARGRVKRDIDRAMTDSPMDYSSTLDECSGEIVIEVPSVQELDARQLRLSGFYPKAAERLKALTTLAANNANESFRLSSPVKDLVLIVIPRSGCGTGKMNPADSGGSTGTGSDDFGGSER